MFTLRHGRLIGVGKTEKEKISSERVRAKKAMIHCKDGVTGKDVKACSSWQGGGTENWWDEQGG